VLLSVLRSAFPEPPAAVSRSEIFAGSSKNAATALSPRHGQTNMEAGMTALSRILLCGSFLLALPAPADVHSRWIRIEQGGVVADDKGGFHLLQVISNTSHQPLWITVQQGEEASGCWAASKIEPRLSAKFDCNAGDVKPGNIPVEIGVFADEAYRQTLETIRDVVHFEKGDVRKRSDLDTGPRFPVTFEGVAFSEKLGIGAALRQLIPHANGKLVISASTIEYVNGNQSVTIPLTSVHEMGLTPEPRGSLPWIVVLYEESAKPKLAAFQPLDHPGDLRGIVESLEAAVKGAKDGTEQVPGETLGSPGLRRDTVRTILEFEKVLAPDCASPKVVDTKVVRGLSNAAVRDGRPVSGDWSESWVVERCGTRVTYGVSYTTDPKGGTLIGIQKP
jgi:hypothetical protein